jgi:hypothetical protein
MPETPEETLDFSDFLEEPVAEESPASAHEPQAQPQSATPSAQQAPPVQQLTQEAQPQAEQPAQPSNAEEVRQRLLAEIAKRYTVNDEMAAQLMTEPGKVLPQIAASLYLDVVSAALNLLVQQLPQMIGQYMTARSAEEQFFERWPELRDPKYHKAIREVALALQSAEPNLTPEQARERIGATVMAMYGLAPNAPRPVRPPVPASPGSVAFAPQASGPKTIWEELAEVT